MYLISEIKKKTRLWWEWICQVFYTTGSGITDMTETIWESWMLPINLLKGIKYKDRSFKITYWSGTGFDRLKAIIRMKEPTESVYSVSVYNQ